MALTATMYNFEIALSDVDRNVYDTLSLRVACHPSETPEYLLTRVLAYCLEFTEGIAFGKGLSDATEAPLTVRDLTGALKVWIDIGQPDAARLHKASLAGSRVVVYTHKDPRVYLTQLASARIHNLAALEIYAFDREMLSELAERLDRRLLLSVSISDREMYITLGEETFSSSVERLTIDDKREMRNERS